MRKMMIVVSMFVVAILSLAVQAEAQTWCPPGEPAMGCVLNNQLARNQWNRTYGNRGAWGGLPSAYGGLDPRIIWGPRDGKDDYGREMEPRDLQEYVHQGVRLQGTYHAERGELHFRPWDSTHNPFNENHKTCLVVGPADDTPEVTQQIVYVEREPAPTPARDLPKVDGWTQTGSMETKMLLNQFTQAPVRVYNGSEQIAELAPGASTSKEVPVNAKIWAKALLENPNTGTEEWITLQSGVVELPFKSGWEFSNPDNHQVM